MSISPDSTFDANENLSFIKSNKGQPLLVMNEQLYKCNKKTARKKYWICIVNGCSMVVHTDENDVYLYGETIYMDGTFSKASSHFVQIYIIHGIKHGACVPCLFALMVNKKAATYRQLFSELKNLALDRNKNFLPKLFVTDFESGVIPVLKADFPSSKHYGCYFHYTQCIFRNLKQLGMQSKYVSDESVRGLCKKLMALAMMPENTVLSAYDEINKDAQMLPDSPMKPLLNYFEKNWLSNVDMWNVYAAESRTNNICEAYHSRINCRILRNHPNIWKFIKFLQAEEKRAQLVIIQWSAGASKKQQPRTAFIQSRINTLYARYNDGVINSSDLLTGLSLVVGAKKKRIETQFTAEE
ncbi:unnamed protein product [Rotaria magnacalcarata]|uniref:MULE transposase domain-containing protein n=1 Tax=Rotaria magnacalcarata TaxID=392030 RepID=A0A819YVZ4_9BILA|nr:unnamed protein product [Rotaria magnacalcarata]